MRLKTIKLAGFKSFVDPTSVDFPSNMCAVVGPNGCGKSNIIDAVRWVMGESSAKNLRGEAMTDVIFNGSGSRKPVGQASIELIFDNSDGKITGEFAGYNEISVKRRVTRDGQNLYYLNANRCRRRDITDIFLGTGLGPRSYAIIEQGMISRLIEARPEELRVYIEEAAGISKYKERRRDTENRMRRTHENLERLTDIREELERQLARLERQARAAEKYAVHKAEERELNAKLRAIHYRVLRDEADALKQQISNAELSLEGAITQRVKLDTEIEKQRAEFTTKSDEFNEVQGQFYALGADIARIEQTIKHASERERSLRIDLEQTERDCRESQDHQSLDAAKIEGWEAELIEIDPELALLDETLEHSQEALQQAEQGMQEWQQSWDQFNQRSAQPKQQAEVQQSRIQYLEQVQTRLNQRREKLLAEASAIVLGDEAEEIALLEELQAESELRAETLSDALSEISQHISALRDQLAEQTELRLAEQGEVQRERGRLASLDALQSAALGKEGDASIQWCAKHGLNGERRLAEFLDVDAGWERAAEVVLGSSLQAVCTDSDLDEFIHQLAEFEQSLQLLGVSQGHSYALATTGQSLSQLVRSPYAVESLLGGIYVAENLSEARAKVTSLAGTESVVTRDGYWLGPGWLRVTRHSDSEAGVLQRQQEIERLQQTLAEREQKLETLSQSLQDLAQALKQAEQAHDEKRREHDTSRREASEQLSQLTAKKSRVQQLVQQKERTQNDIRDIDEQLKLEAENLAEARALLEEAIEAIEADSEEREHLLGRRDELRASLDQARQNARQAQDKRHELAMRQRGLKTQLDSIRQGLQRLHEQIARLHERRDQLKQALEETAVPGEEQQLELEALLEKRLAVETRLSESRRAVEETEQALRHAEKARDQSERVVGEQRSGLESSRLQLQTLEVRAQTIHQQLHEDEFELESVLARLSETDLPQTLEAELEEVASRIARLGPINLAAIEEYKTESERKQYLDEQNADLREALETLEEAIKKIDKETRTRFKETYDQVNSGLQALFPRLFGGGHAYLELTGEDLLDTGIAIMARPPGKKNSTIHLLSGGEKALTAIALVFSIFQLNPAPFCMLDEVDAPLDDANVGRYANIVEAMSEHVQFIYITHNKIAMEKARHLMGVTMQEAGVSRMVTVDVEEAAELAAV